MLSTLRQKLGVAFARLQLGNNHENVIAFTNALHQAKKALIIFPETLIDRDSVVALFRYIINKFSPDNTILLIHENQLFSISSMPSIKKVTYSQEDLNRLFLPRKKLVRKIERCGVDIAIDLNIKFSLCSAYICKASKAPVRVSFAKKNGDYFYNFQFRAKNNGEDSLKYKNLLKCLEMFQA